MPRDPWAGTYPHDGHVTLHLNGLAGGCNYIYSFFCGFPAT